MSGTIVGLGDLPNETLLEIFKHLSANQDIPNVSLVCQRFNQVTCNDSLWAHFAKQDYGADIKLTTTSSIKIIYQKLLNIYGPLLGLYKRVNFEYYGQLIKIHWRTEDCKIVFQHLVTPPTVNHSVMKETIATLGINQDGQVHLVEKGYPYKDIFVGKLSINMGHKNLFSEVQGDQLKIGDLLDLDIVPYSLADTLTIINSEQKILNPEVVFDRCVQYALKEWSYDHYSLHRKVLGLCKIEGHEFGTNDNLDSVESCPPLGLMILTKIDVKWNGLELFPIKGGLFKGDYGSHGVEFISLEMPRITHQGEPHRSGPSGVQGVKMTGDPNVPFGHFSFRITDNRPLIIPKEAQTSFEALYLYSTENPQFAVADQDVSRTHFDVHQIFSTGVVHPVQLNRLQYFEDVGTECKGVWMCECQVAGDGYHDPSQILGLFIAYNNDMFGVVFLDLGCVSAFKRVKNL